VKTHKYCTVLILVTHFISVDVLLPVTMYSVFLSFSYNF